jgi:outer membrane protein assembly factor BamB
MSFRALRSQYMVLTRFARVAAAITLVLGLTARASATPVDWPQFRGQTGQGIAADATPPLEWSESRNITWKVEIPGKGWSSPVVSGDQIWLTTATEGGRSLRALALDLATGKLLHDVELFRYERPPRIQPKNSHASPTPIIEGGRVYVHFGTQGTAALTRDGEIVWKTTALKYEPGHGSGGSPVLWDDLLIISCDGIDRQFVVALDKNSGEIRWQTDRRGAQMAFSTPLVIEAGGRTQVVSPGAIRAISYDAATGKQLWSIRYGGFSNVPRPVFGHGLVYVSSGFYDPVLYAVRPDGAGDVTDSRIEWTYARGVPLTPSALLVGDEIYIVSDSGIATCLDAKTGREHWRSRLNGMFSASPVFAGGRIYFLDEDGRTTVIKPGTTFRELAMNEIDGRTLASIAVIGKIILLRSETHLYRIEEK